MIQAPINSPCYQVQVHATLAKNLQLNVLLKVNMLKSQINHPTITEIQLRRRISQKITAFLKRFLVNSIDQYKVFGQYPWLHYDESKDSLFCYICFNQNAKGNLISARKSEKTFITSGFSNWKKALLRFNEHQTSECHQLAVDHEIKIPKTNLNIIDLSNTNAQKVRKENRHVFAKVVETLQSLAGQGIAIRGDNEQESNFLQLLKLRAKDDGLLASHRDGGLKYASHDIQNEILSLIANEVIRDLLKQIGENYYSLICDEYTDIVYNEQLTLCLRWVDNELVAHEDFFGFYKILNIAADTTVSVVEDALARLTLSLDKCRGQCYNGASNMLGKKSGVATRIQELQPKAFITH